MKNSVNLILNTSFEDLISSADVLVLLKTYSILYNGGAECSTCVNSCKRYYNQIKKNGKEMIELHKKVKNRTCIPNWKGVRYSRKTNNHISSNMLDDDTAKSFLEKGILRESDFKKLPDCYINVQLSEFDKLSEEEKECVLEIKHLLEVKSAKEIKSEYKHIDKIGDKKCTIKLLTSLINIAKEL